MPGRGALKKIRKKKIHFLLRKLNKENVENKGAAAPARFAFAKIRAMKNHSLQ
jgi:hypothetical protein